MAQDPAALSGRARVAAQARDWRTVHACAAAILQSNPASPEGCFLAGLAARGAGRAGEAARAFERALQLDAGRYDAAIELAALCQSIGHNADAGRLLAAYEPRLANSPMYLDLAGTTWSRMGLHERAGPLFERANRLQPGVESLQANLAACRVYLGRIQEAIDLYEDLLRRYPLHQRFHYELSRLRPAADERHVQQMKQVLEETRLPPARNIFLYYALGKELEDLGQWDEAFRYYELAGNAARSVSPYDVAADLETIDRLIEVCSPAWLGDESGRQSAEPRAVTPIFVTGLPRSGTTLVERILSSHSQVESAGETFFMQEAIRQLSGITKAGIMTAPVIAAAAQRPIGDIARAYRRAAAYRLSGKPFFIDKFPENFLYLGFIAKGFPEARIVVLRRHPMDVCFAMYKQSFFRYAFDLDELGQYYAAHERLRRHWHELLGERLVEVRYEELVADQEGQTRELLARLGLEFEPACLAFERNPTPVDTASAAQVREGIHARSVGKWRHFASHLEPLCARLEAVGIDVS